jgi:Arm DNA-binding domain
MPENLLNDTAIRKAVPGEKARKLNDGAGLVLEVRPEGGKWWRYRYRFDGKEKMLSLGTYPAVSLAEARSRRNAARDQIAAGINPSDVRKDAKEARAHGQVIGHPHRHRRAPARHL